MIYEVNFKPKTNVGTDSKVAEELSELSKIRGSIMNKF